MMQRERKSHTLSATDLFHEAYARLHALMSEPENFQAKAKGLFAITMRRVLLEHARKRNRRMRISAQLPSPSEKTLWLHAARQGEFAEKLIDLDQALERLAQDYPIHAKIVELRYFGGMTVLQCAEHLGIGSATVQRYWTFARAWIGREMERIDKQPKN
jgi:RNA polymerase sigma factor (TIGR02999 family)